MKSKLFAVAIGVVELTVQRLREKYFHLSARASEPDLSIGWQDGNIYKMEVSVEQKKAALDVIQQDLDWIRDNVDVLAAHGLKDAPEDLRRVLRRLDVGFADEFLAAQANHRLLLSEDMSYRAIGAELFDLDTTWIQPILMMARKNGIINQQRYNEIIVSMIQYRASFISIDKDVLLMSLHQISELPLPKDYRCLADTLGGPDADMRSHISVAIEVVAELWDRRPNLVAMAATGHLLDCLFRNQTVKVTVLVQLLRVYAHRLITAKFEFLEYLEAWMKGHFINA